LNTPPCTPTPGKKKIVSRPSGCTRRSRRTGRNLANPDASYHGVGRVNAATTVVCVQRQRTRAPCIWMQLLWYIRFREGVSGHEPSGRNACVPDARCPGRWRQDDTCHGTSRPDAAIKAQHVQTQLSRHNASRCSCQGTTRSDAAVKAQCIQT